MNLKNTKEELMYINNKKKNIRSKLAFDLIRRLAPCNCKKEDSIWHIQLRESKEDQYDTVVEKKICLHEGVLLLRMDTKKLKPCNCKKKKLSFFESKINGNVVQYDTLVQYKVCKHEYRVFKDNIFTPNINS
jgi:hypothetical protein